MKISLIARKGLGELLLNLHLVDQFFAIEKGNEATYRQAAESLNNEEVDFVICPHQSFRSARLARRIKAKQKKVGFSQWWAPFFFGETLAKPMELPDALRQLSLLQLVSPEFAKQWQGAELSALKNSNDNSATVFFGENKIPDWASMSVAERVEPGAHDSKDDKPLALLAPGSVWNTKKWTEQGFVDLSRLLVKQGYRIKLIGSKAEYEICERVRGGRDDVENRAGLDSLMGSLQLMKSARVLVSNDSGAMHLASLVELPIVSVFGPTVLSLGYRPWLEKSAVVQIPLDCRPCGKHGHKVCPIGTHQCMKDISAEKVMAAIEQL